MDSIVIKRWRPKALDTFGLGLPAAFLLVWSGVAQAAPPPQSFAELAQKVTPAVVNIASSQMLRGQNAQEPALPFDVPNGSPYEKFFEPFRDQREGLGRGAPPPRMATGLGSGFIVDPSGYVVTNNHVADGAADVKVTLDDDSVYPATIVGVDPQTDLALLKIEAKRQLPALQFDNSDMAQVGDWVMAVGNPFGLGGTVTAGIVSARGRNIQAGPYDDFLQIDAAINRGNSGGPLFNMDGKVIGVNTAIFSPNGGSVGLGFAIPSNIAKTVIAQLKENGQVERGWLGARIQSITPEIAAAVGLKEPYGAMVTDVTPGSPAAKAGLRQGDAILSFANQTIGDPREPARLVASESAGSKRAVTVWRDRASENLTVVTGRQPAEAQVAERNSGAETNGAYHSAQLNADLLSLTPERRAEFGIPDEVNGYWF